MEHVPATYKMLTRGLKLVNPDFPRLAPRVVRDVFQARAKGYMVVTFEDGSRTSGHESTVVFVAVGQ
jgi:DNA polymerase elongation subunit (family B)